MTRLVIATRNAHKAEEIRAILGGRFEYLTLRDLPGAPEVEETGATFEANARLKAGGIASWLLAQPAGSGEATDRFVLADDSGLEVDALDGAPGVQSARFAAAQFGIAGNAPDAANNQRLLRLLADVPTKARTARFRCVLALAAVTPAPTASMRCFDGTCEGRIGFAPRGSDGFGYDPLFIPGNHAETFAELGEATKNALSHRAKALARLRDWLDSTGGGSPVV